MTMSDYELEVANREAEKGLRWLKSRHQFDPKETLEVI